MLNHADLHRRLDELARDLRQSEFEDLLTEGYARALDGEAQSRRLEQQLAELLPEIDNPGVAKEIRRLALERRTVDQAVRDLRDKLAEIRERVTTARGAGRRQPDEARCPSPWTSPRRMP